jgi:hypothetical protein
MVRKSEKPRIESEFRQEIGEEIKEIGYNRRKNCIEIWVSEDPEQLVRDITHLSDEWSIQVAKGHLRVY